MRATKPNSSKEKNTRENLVNNDRNKVSAAKFSGGNKIDAFDDIFSTQPSFEIGMQNKTYGHGYNNKNLKEPDIDSLLERSREPIINPIFDDSMKRSGSIKSQDSIDMLLRDSFARNNEIRSRAPLPHYDSMRNNEQFNTFDRADLNKKEYPLDTEHLKMGMIKGFNPKSILPSDLRDGDYKENLNNSKPSSQTHYDKHIKIGPRKEFVQEVPQISDDPLPWHKPMNHVHPYQYPNHNAYANRPFNSYYRSEADTNREDHAQFHPKPAKEIRSYSYNLPDERYPPFHTPNREFHGNYRNDVFNPHYERQTVDASYGREFVPHRNFDDNLAAPHLKFNRPEISHNNILNMRSPIFRHDSLADNSKNDMHPEVSSLRNALHGFSPQIPGHRKDIRQERALSVGLEPVKNYAHQGNKYHQESLYHHPNNYFYNQSAPMNFSSQDLYSKYTSCVNAKIRFRVYKMEPCDIQFVCTQEDIDLRFYSIILTVSRLLSIPVLNFRYVPEIKNILFSLSQYGGYLNTPVSVLNSLKESMQHIKYYAAYVIPIEDALKMGKIVHRSTANIKGRPVNNKDLEACFRNGSCNDILVILNMLDIKSKRMSSILFDLFFQISEILFDRKLVKNWNFIKVSKVFKSQIYATMDYKNNLASFTDAELFKINDEVLRILQKYESNRNVYNVVTKTCLTNIFGLLLYKKSFFDDVKIKDQCDQQFFHTIITFKRVIAGSRTCFKLLQSISRIDPSLALQSLRFVFLDKKRLEKIYKQLKPYIKSRLAHYLDTMKKNVLLNDKKELEIIVNIFNKKECVRKHFYKAIFVIIDYVKCLKVKNVYFYKKNSSSIGDLLESIFRYSGKIFMNDPKLGEKLNSCSDLPEIKRILVSGLIT